MPKLNFRPFGSEALGRTGTHSEDLSIRPGSEEQEAIWKEAKEGQRHIVVRSVAGSGKTWTGVQYCLRERNLRLAYVAFNKHIQSELAGKIQQTNVTCRTYHSLGLAALRNALGSIEIDQYKTDQIIDSLNFGLNFETNRSRAAYLKSRVRKLVGLAKQYGVIDRSELEILVDHHLIDLTNIEEETYDLVPKVLIEAKANTETIDYDDMIWLPKELDITMPHYDIMLIDEAQDTNPSQQWLALNSADRLIVIGDVNQAIYGFRGADIEAIPQLEKALAATSRGVVSMPLSFTRRCPKSHVALAQKIVPGIHALPDAPEGVVKLMGERQAINAMQPGDLVLCRVNAELIGVAYKLIQRGVKAVVRGRDIGEGVGKLLDLAEKKATSKDLGEVLKAAYEITMELVHRYHRMPQGKGAHRAAAASDRWSCLNKLSEEAESIADIRYRIEQIFADFNEDGKPNSAVILGTVHRTKGLEAGRVYVLRPDLIPHPAARQAWERVQERNLGYVAVTRAVYQNGNPGELIWVGGESPLFVSKEDQV